MMTDNGKFREYRNAVILTISSNLTLGWSGSPRFPIVSEVILSGFTLESSKSLAEDLGIFSLSGGYLSIGSSVRSPWIFGRNVESIHMN